MSISRVLKCGEWVLIIEPCGTEEQLDLEEFCRPGESVVGEVKKNPQEMGPHIVLRKEKS